MSCMSSYQRHPTAQWLVLPLHRCPPPGVMIVVRAVLIDLVHMLTDPTRLFLCRGLVAFVLQKRSIATHFVDESRRRGKGEGKEGEKGKEAAASYFCLSALLCLLENRETKTDLESPVRNHPIHSCRGFRSVFSTETDGSHCTD